MGDYFKTQTSPFTLTEAMRVLQLKGPDRWPLGLIHKFGMRDILNCQAHRWTALFYSEDKVIQFDQFDRQVLGWAAAAAIEQLKRIVTKQQQGPDIPN